MDKTQSKHSSYLIICVEENKLTQSKSIETPPLFCFLSSPVPAPNFSYPSRSCEGHLKLRWLAELFEGQLGAISVFT